MKVQLTKIGDEYGIVLNDAWLEVLQFGPNTPLTIETDGKALYVRAAGPEDDEGDAEPEEPGRPAHPTGGNSRDA